MHGIIRHARWGIVRAADRLLDLLRLAQDRSTEYRSGPRPARDRATVQPTAFALIREFQSAAAQRIAIRCPARGSKSRMLMISLAPILQFRSKRVIFRN